MMTNEPKPKRGRGWHGNSEGHAAVARRKGRAHSASSSVTKTTAVNDSATDGVSGNSDS